ncbi:MAG: NAD+ synthase [Gaiellales bacterium]
MRLALAQLNPVVGDLDGNRDRIAERLGQAREAGADLVLFPELALTGYPPEDLLLRPAFLRAAWQRLEELARHADGIAALVGVPHLDRDLFNACAVLADRTVRAVYHKRFLPNYGVFDEDRYFQSGRELLLLSLGETLIGPTVCEDIWQPGPPTTDLTLAGAHVIANLSASPFHLGKGREREEMLAARARDNVCWVAFVNAVGGQDELVFDGHSLVIDQEGRIVARAPAFEEALLVVDIDATEAIGHRLRDARRRALARERETLPQAQVVDLGPPHPQRETAHGTVTGQLDGLEEMRRALVLGLGDYAAKNGFSEIVLGSSGGIDSALTAALAVEAVGADRVVCVSMPSRFTSAGTRNDARAVAESLGCRFLELAIEPIVEAFTAALAGPFAGLEPGLAEENIQARARGTLLMALSNKFGWLLVATGNKSEYCVGYATLYGDMAGGFALLKDVFKTDVFRLSRYLNEQAGRELIPASIIERPPTAELRENQLDEDSLPPYDALDPVLAAYVERDLSREELLLDGFDPAVVDRAVSLTDLAEYKRRQAPPGVKLRPKAFGRDRRLPITNHFRS